MDATPIARIGNIPVYDQTLSRPVPDSLICVTCTNAKSRHVTTPTGRVICQPAQSLYSLSHHTCGCVLTGSETHRHSPDKFGGGDKDMLVRSDGTKEELIAPTKARVATCGWSIRPECEHCVHFVALHHVERVEGRFGSKMRPNSLLREETQIGGWCGLPVEGVRNRKGQITHCLPTYRSREDRNAPASCANCAFAVRPGDWPNNGLAVFGDSVVRVDADPVEILLARDDSWVPDEYRDRIDDLMCRLRITPGAPGLAYYRARLRNASPRGWFTAYPAEVLECHTEPVTVGDTKRHVPVNVLLRLPGTSEIRFFVRTGEAYRFRIRRKAGWRNGVWYRSRLIDEPVPPGDVTVTVIENRAVVELRIDPWVNVLGISQLRGRRVFSKAKTGPSYEHIRPLANRSVEHCPACRADFACDAHARGLVELPREPLSSTPEALFGFRYPAARDPRLAKSETPPRSSIIVETKDLPPRMPPAAYPGGAVGVRSPERITSAGLESAHDEVLVSSGRLEPGMWSCLMNLHGVGGVDLMSACGWKIPGEGRWDPVAHNPVSPRSNRSATLALQGEFYDFDAWDQMRAMSMGARIQEAIDAAAAVDGTWNPHSGQWKHHPPLDLKDFTKTRLDLFGAETIPDNYPFGYSRFEDAAEFHRWLEDVVIVDGVPMTNRRRFFGYDIFVPPQAKATTSWTSFVEPAKDYDLRDFEPGSLFGEDSMDGDDEEDRDDRLDLAGIDDPPLGIDIIGAVHEEELSPYELLEVYCPDCQKVTTTTVAVAGVWPDDDLICPDCLAVGHILGVAEQVPSGIRQPSGFCPACNTVVLDSVTPIGDACPECDAPLVAVAERVNDVPEKSGGILIWRSSDDMIRRRQLENICCPLWVRRGSGQFDRPVVGLKTLAQRSRGGRGGGKQK